MSGATIMRRAAAEHLVTHTSWFLLRFALGEQSAAAWA